MSGAIVVLGGGVRAGGVLPPWVRARFDLALSMSAIDPVVCCSAGTVHRPPPLDQNGFPWLECSAGARYAIQRGCDPARILLESVSLDTIGNAYFSRVLHADPAGWQRVTVITSEFHMPRAEAIFRWVYGLDRGYDLDFKASPDVGLADAVLAVRREKEKASLAGFRQLAPRIADLRQLRDWLNSEHAAYSASHLDRAPSSSGTDTY